MSSRLSPEWARAAITVLTGLGDRGNHLLTLPEQCYVRGSAPTLREGALAADLLEILDHHLTTIETAFRTN
ncbi:hypothetical protein GCM10010404_19800 [Nonomuraea africana]